MTEGIPRNPERSEVLIRGNADLILHDAAIYSTYSGGQAHCFAIVDCQTGKVIRVASEPSTLAEVEAAIPLTFKFHRGFGEKPNEPFIASVASVVAVMDAPSGARAMDRMDIKGTHRDRLSENARSIFERSIALVRYAAEMQH